MAQQNNPNTTLFCRTIVATEYEKKLLNEDYRQRGLPMFDETEELKIRIRAIHREPQSVSKTLEETNAELLKEKERLEIENERLKIENERLKTENERYVKELSERLQNQQLEDIEQQE